MKHEFNPNRDPYYKYMLCYVDDLLYIGFKTKEDMDSLNMIYRLNEVFGPPDWYLGEIFEKVQLKDGWVLSSTKFFDYFKSAILNDDDLLGLDKMALENYVDGHKPHSSSSRPELDVIEELGEELTNRYQHLIGVLRWLIKLGRIDILTEVCCLSQYFCSPR